MFCKKGVLRKFAKFTGKQTPVPETLFDKVSGLSPATLFKRDSDTGVFL